MIQSTLTQSKRVEALHPLFKKVFDYVKTHDLRCADLGKIELDGEDLFINNVESLLVPKEEQFIETHRKYIDIHIPLDAPETIGWRSLETLSLQHKSYDEEGDFAFYKDIPTMYTVVYPGEFLILFPEDGHAPIIGEGKIRKLIAKVKL